MLVSPANPTGAVYPPEEVAAIGEWALDRGIWVLCDAVYRHLVYGSAVFSSLPVQVPKMVHRTVIVGSVSKTFAMTGWRVGWLIGPPAVVDAVTRLQAHSTSNVANVSQQAALAALTGPMDSVEEMRQEFDRRRILMHRLLDEIPGVSTVEPRGAFFAFPSVADLLGQPLGRMTPSTSAELADALLDQAEVAVVPGEAFGAPGHLRLSFAVGDAEIEEGLQRWKALVEA